MFNVQMCKFRKVAIKCVFCVILSRKRNLIPTICAQNLRFMESLLRKLQKVVCECVSVRVCQPAKTVKTANSAKIQIALFRLLQYANLKTNIYMYIEKGKDQEQTLARAKLLFMLVLPEAAFSEAQRTVASLFYMHR